MESISLSGFFLWGLFFKDFFPFDAFVRMLAERQRRNYHLSVEKGIYRLRIRTIFGALSDCFLERFWVVFGLFRIVMVLLNTVLLLRGRWGFVGGLLVVRGSF